MDNKLKVDEIGRLYLLRQVFENIISDAEQSVQKEDDSNKIKLIELNLNAHKQQLEAIDERVKELRDNFFQFSVEELYAMYGRYDKFISIEFHPKSESARKFSKNIMGIFLFNRRQRQDLNEDLERNPIPRTNGYVRIAPSELSNLTEEQVNDLKRVGFLSGDVFEINHTAIDYNDRYKEEGKKEIPGTINIEFDPTGFNPELMGLNLYKRRISDNSKPMIEAEWDEYYAYKILYDKSSITEDEWNEKIYKPDSKVIKDSIQHFIFRSKLGRMIMLSQEETIDFIKLNAKRKKERHKLVDKEINRSANKKLREIIKENEEAVAELKRIAYFYKEENLSPYGAKYPVYLDLERYLHIFIRHFEDFQVGNWKGGKSSFQYNFKDTKRLIEIVIRELQPHIDEAIDNGREFKIYDMKAHNYNGNYYVVHVDKNGRLLAFYPHENE